jgi:hypothetical protein
MRLAVACTTGVALWTLQQTTALATPAASSSYSSIGGSPAGLTSHKSKYYQSAWITWLTTTDDRGSVEMPFPMQSSDAHNTTTETSARGVSTIEWSPDGRYFATAHPRNRNRRSRAINTVHDVRELRSPYL